MPKKKTLPTLSTLYSGIEDLQITLKNLVRQINLNFQGVGSEFMDIHKELRELNKRFDNQEDIFVEWKNELFTKIDNNYAKPLSDLQIESDVKQVRLENHEERISKLEKSGRFLAA